MSLFASLFRKINALFVVTVVVPTFLAGLYYGLVASDVYISESRFVLRSPGQQTATPLGMLLKSTGFTRSQDDSYTVTEYIHSRDALSALDAELDLRAAFAKGDIFTQFPGLDRDDSFEGMHRYYQDMVTVQLDPLSAIARLKVRAFTAEEARQINHKLLEMSEGLVNKLNERGRQDLVRFAFNEVTAAQARAKQAAVELAKYRNDKGVIDPERQSAIPLQQIAKLQDELIIAKTQLAQLQRTAAQNPQISVLKSRVEMLESEIQRESLKVAGGSRSLASKAAEFQRLALDKEFADKQLASAMLSLEQARNEAQRKQLYLERIAQPSLPDAALEPRRIRIVLSVLVLGLIAWGVLSLLVAGVKEHVD